MPAKTCRKHRKSFYGPRCPDCVAPPSYDKEEDDQELPFNTEISNSLSRIEEEIRISHNTGGDARVLETTFGIKVENTQQTPEPDLSFFDQAPDVTSSND